MKKRRTEHNFAGFANSSKKAIFALLIIAAALTAYSFAEAAVVSHHPNAIQPQGPAGEFNAATLNGFSSASILALAAGGGGWTVDGANVYKTDVSGKVGIGTTSPGYKLDVQNSGGWKARFGGPDGYIDMGPANTGWAHIYTDRPNFIFNVPVWSIGNAFSSYSTGDLSLQTNGITRIFARNTDGKVGIGTTNPGAKLEITGDLRFSSGATRVIDTPSATLRIIPDSNLELGTAFTDNVWIGRTDVASSTIFYGGTAGAEVMRLTSGKVGIGTIDPKSTLDVSGGVRIGRFTTKPTCDANTVGMFVFDTTADKPFVCSQNSGWKPTVTFYPITGGWTQAGPGGSTGCVSPLSAPMGTIPADKEEAVAILRLQDENNCPVTPQIPTGFLLQYNGAAPPTVIPEGDPYPTTLGRYQIIDTGGTGIITIVQYFPEVSSHGCKIKYNTVSREFTLEETIPDGGVYYYGGRWHYMKCTAKVWYR